MKNILQLGAITLIAVGVFSCGKSGSSNITGSVIEDVDSDILMNATVVVLVKHEFSILESDAVTGLVTTDWKSETSLADQILWGQAYQIRATVVIDFLNNEVTVQMKRQVKDYIGRGEYSPWRTTGLHKEDKRLRQLILTEIQLKAHEIQDRG